MNVMMACRTLIVVMVLVIPYWSFAEVIETERGGIIVCFKTMDCPLGGSVAVEFDSNSAFEDPGLNYLSSRFGLVGGRPLNSRPQRSRNTYVFEFPAGSDLGEIAAEYALNENVFYAEENLPVEVLGDPVEITPNDFWYNHTYDCGDPQDCNMVDSSHLRQWNLVRGEFDRAWGISTGDSTNCIIAILDTEFDRFHHDLVDRIWKNPAEYWGTAGADDDSNGLIDDIFGWDFVDDDNEVYVADPDTTWGEQHGTQMIGIIGASTNNEPGSGENPGIAGVTWKNKLLPLRTIGPSFVSDSIDAIEYCIERKVVYGDSIKVINCSWRTGYSNALRIAIEDATDAGILVVAGAGNYDGEIVYYPCSYDDVLCMSCVDFHDKKLVGGEGSTYSNYVDACGYGSIYTNWTWPGPTYEGVCSYDFEYPRLPYFCLGVVDTLLDNSWASCGDVLPHVTGITRGLTSGATAQASGLVGLIRSTYPDLTPAQSREMVKRGCIDIADSNSGTPWVNKLGAGRISGYRSLTLFGTILRDTTLSGEVWVSDDVVVGSSVTLTLAAGSQIHVAPDSAASGFGTNQIVVNGSLSIQGTGQDPVVFSSWADNVTESDWGGIIINDTATDVDIDYLVVRHADVGIEIHDVDVDLAYSEFDSCGTGMSVVGGVVGSTIGPGVVVANSAGTGIYHNGGRVTYDDVSISGSGLSGFYVDGDGWPVVLSSGISVVNSGLHGAHFEDVSDSTVVENLTISDSANSGVRITSCSPQVLNSVEIAGPGSAGLFFVDSSSEVTGVSISNVTSGMRVFDQSDPHVRECVLSGCVYGVFVNFDSYGDFGSVSDEGLNELGDMTKYAVNWNSSNSLPFQYNCFDGSPTASSTMFGTKSTPYGISNGVIVYSPGLCQ